MCSPSDVSSPQGAVECILVANCCILQPFHSLNVPIQASSAILPLIAGNVLVGTYVHYGSSGASSVPLIAGDNITYHGSGSINMTSLLAMVAVILMGAPAMQFLGCLLILKKGQNQN